MNLETKPLYSNKWIRKFMRRAREVSESVDCGSRKVGCVLMKDKISISDGFNGPPMGCSRNCERIRAITTNVKEPYYDNTECMTFVPIDDDNNFLSKDPFTLSYLNDWRNGKNVCPRKLLGYESGKNLKICNCQHSEQNSINAAAKRGYPTEGASCFLYPISPCKDCLGSLVNAGIIEIYATHLYNDKLSEIILEESKISLFLVDNNLLDLNPEDKTLNDPKWVTKHR